MRGRVHDTARLIRESFTRLVPPTGYLSSCSERWNWLRYFPILTGVFVAVLMISQVTAVKPVNIGLFGVVITGADLIFPISYLMGDVLTEVYGFALAGGPHFRTGLAADVFKRRVIMVRSGAISGRAGLGHRKAVSRRGICCSGLAPRIALARLDGVHRRGICQLVRAGTTKGGDERASFVVAQLVPASSAKALTR